MGCDTAYMGAFLCMPLFLTQAVGMTIADASWILGVSGFWAYFSHRFLLKTRLFVKTGSGQTYDSLKTIGGFSQCRPAMGSVIAIVLAKLMGEKKEGRCTVSNLNLTLVGCTVSVIACELHTAS